MTNHEVPLYMNGKVIGRISVNRETGDFSGAFDSELMPILEEGMDSGAKSVTFESLYGLFAHTYLNAQQRLSAYLDHGQRTEELEEEHCSRISLHSGHKWVAEMGKGQTYWCMGDVVDVEEDDTIFYTLREAHGNFRVLRKNVYGLKNAKQAAKQMHEITRGSVAWEKQPNYIV